MPETVCLFDLDGTLTDPREGITACIRHAFQALDRTPPSEASLLSWIGPPIQESFRAALDGCEQSAARAVAVYRERFDRIGWRENHPVPGVVNALAILNEAGVPCYLATSKPQVFAERIVNHFRFDRWLAGVYGSQLDGTRADKSDLLRHIVDDRKLADRDVVMIGDRRHDVDGARANGLRSVGVLWGFGDRDELTAAQVDAIATHPGELPALCLPRLDGNAGEMVPAAYHAMI